MSWTINSAPASRVRTLLVQILCFAMMSVGAASVLAQDSDGDTIVDSADNCLTVPNVNQSDTDNDGLGNVCDADLNQDCVVNFIDVSLFSQRFLSTDPDADFNGDGAVNFLDYVLLTSAFLSAPGPSGVANLCAPTNSLTLSGTTGPIPLVQGVISAVVNQTASGGGVIVVNSSTDLEGNFDLVIDSPNDSDFVTIAAIGLGGQLGVSLSSLAGSVEALSQAGGNDGSVNSTQASALALSSLTTAFSVLASEAQGVDVSNQADLDAVEKLVEGGTYLDLATIITMLIQNPQVSLPAGSTDILTFAADSGARENLRVRLLTERPDEYDVALANTLFESPDTYAADSPSGTLYSVFLNNFNRLGDASKLEFGAGNSVTLTNERVIPSTWSIDPDGVLVVVPAVPLVPVVSLMTIEDPDNPGEFIQAEQNGFTETYRFIRFRDGQTVDHVVGTTTGFTEFPDYPQLGTTPVATVPGTLATRLLADEAVSIPFSPMELVNAGMSLDYYHRDNASEGTNIVERGFDTLDFDNDGTGTTRRRGFGFEWEVLANGELSLVFGNGDTNRYRRLLPNGDGTGVGSVFFELNGAGQAVSRAFFVSRDEAAAFVDPDLANRSYRSALAALSTLELSTLRVFDFALSEAGVMCRNPDSGSSTWTWTVADGRLDIFRQIGTPGSVFFSRTWDPLLIVDNRYWVIETLQTEFDGGPVLDPATLPGRLNVYSIVHENVANSRPVLNDDSYVTSVDTPIIIYVDDLFANDVDPEGDEIVLRSVSQGSEGGFFSNQNSLYAYPYAYVYNPPAGFTGTETFEISASDIVCRGELPELTSTISITVN